MSAEENMALARRFLEARVAKSDLDAVDEMLALDFVNHNRLLSGQESSRRGYLRAVSAYHAAFSPGYLILEDQVAGGIRWCLPPATHSVGSARVNLELAGPSLVLCPR